MDISNNTDPGVERAIENEIERRRTLADVSAAANGPFVPHFAVESVAAFGAADEGRTMYVQLQGRDGPGLVLDLASADCDAILEGIVRARAAARALAAGEITKFILTGWKTWEVGHMADGTVVLFFDKGTPNQRAYPFQPSDVFAVGKALVGIARAANSASSRITRN